MPIQNIITNHLTKTDITKKQQHDNIIHLYSNFVLFRKQTVTIKILIKTFILKNTSSRIQ